MAQEEFVALCWGLCYRYLGRSLTAVECSCIFLHVHVTGNYRQLQRRKNSRQTFFTCFAVVRPLKVLISVVTIWHSLVPSRVSHLIPVWRILPYLTLISDPHHGLTGLEGLGSA